MRIVQIIDSLDIGGAEKMAVNYANLLAEKIEFSGLVTTRKEGELKKQLQQKVAYLHLNRKHKIDVKAILKLRKFCVANKVDYLQPHSSSYFTAVLLKLTLPKVKIIWHDHNGLSEFLSANKWFVLKLASFLFKGIIAVNYQLKNWAEKELNCKAVLYLPNFTSFDYKQPKETKLNGVEGKRILCLANLRMQKNHFLLVEVAAKLKQTHPDWSFHLVGKDFEDDYSQKVKTDIVERNLTQTVFVYGSKNDTFHIINQVEIAILTSNSEGLPVALLEYGLLKKPVVSTDVGEIPLIVKNEENGLIVPRGNAEQFYQALVCLIENEVFRNQMATQLYQTINTNNSEQAVLEQYLNWIKAIK